MCFVPVSICLQDEQPLEQALLEPLRVAGSLQVLRINRCMGLQLSLEGERRFALFQGLGEKEGWYEEQQAAL